METSKEDIGFMKARIESIEKKQDEMHDLIKVMKTSMDEGKGARKALYWVYLLVGGVLAFKFGVVSKLFTKG